MGALEQAFPESIDEILAMVKETPRGRWFLEGYEKRLRTTETERILSSIAKLESHIQSVSMGGHDHALVRKAREAIAAARRDIAAIEQKPAELSAEGQLFAKLAALSKQSFSGAPAVSKGVERALRLVSDLDQQFSPAPAVTVEAFAKPADLFKPDEAIFEPAPAPTQLVSARRNENIDALPRGAKLVIQHKGSRAKPETVPFVEAPAIDAISDVGTAVKPDEVPATIKQDIPVTVPPPAPLAEANDLAARSEDQSSGIPHSRIVIIRRKAEDLENLPLLDLAEDSSSATAA